MRVCLIPCDIDGSGCYRLLFPGRMLRERGGHEAAMPPYEIEDLDDGRRLVKWGLDERKSLPDADVYVVQRGMERVWPGLIGYLRRAGRVVVCETDDWFLGTPAYNPASRGTDPYDRSYHVADDGTGRLVIDRVRRRRKPASRLFLHEGFARADALSVSTPFLARAYSRFNRDVTVLPNLLDWDMWTDAQPQYDADRDGRVRVGWMGKAKWRGGDLNVLAGLIPRFLQEHPHVDFVAAGDDGVHDLLGIPDGRRVTVGEAKFLELATLVATMDVGLVPLEMNSFNEAKSWLKGMEYAACGIPCVASPTESYRAWVDPGVNGFLAARPRDWLRHLSLLVTDHDARRRMGRAAREKAMAHTIQQHWPRWEQYYQRVAAKAAAAA